MDSWVTSFIKDIKEKVGISEPPSYTTISQSSLSTREYEVSARSDKSYDYYPSRLQPSELELLIQYVLRMRLASAGDNVLGMIGRLLFLEDLASESASSAPCLEMNMSKMGHACITVPLGERPWPPEAGYTFVCWFQFRNLKSQPAESSNPVAPCLRLFSLCSTYDRSTIYEELYLQEDGTLTLTRTDANQLCFSSLGLEEGQWYHLAVVHSKTDEGLNSIVHVYVNGKLRHTGELPSVPFLVENWQVIIGTPAERARASDLHLTLRSCYLFDENLSADCIRFMYSLGLGCKVQFQGLNSIQSDETGNGDAAARVDSSSGSAIVSSDNVTNLGCSEADINWDLEMMEKLWLELCRKKLLCAFNAARMEALRRSQTLALLNLVDPVSVAAPSTGVPLFGHLHGDIYVCRRCVTGNIIHPISEVAVVLALIDAAETSDMLHISLKLFAYALHQNPMNVQEMKTWRVYHLLAQFIHRKMLLIDIRCLEVLFKIAVSEEPSKLNERQTSLPPSTTVPESSFTDVNSAEFPEEIDDADGFYNDHEVSVENRENFNHEYKLENSNAMARTLISGALSDADVVEHILLDWTIWGTAPAPVQLSIVNFLENLVSVYKHKDHNLTVLRERNVVHHLLVTLHRDDVELLVLEKMAILLCIILQEKFIESELENVTTFLISTFHPIEVQATEQIWRETRSKRVILRNILLESLIDLQMTIASEELLEQWDSIFSSRLITYFLDEAVHATSIAWLITLLGCCLTYSPTFPLEFQRSKGYQALVKVLPHFHDSLDIYYSLFCLMFGKPIYPRLPEVVIQDFEALMPANGDYRELKFPGLLDSIIAMAKSSFGQPRKQPLFPTEAVNSNVETTAAACVQEIKDIDEDVNLEASVSRTLSAQIIEWEAPTANVVSILRLMANLAKMWPSFSNACGQAEFLESCVDLYFSILRAYGAVKPGQESNVATVSIASPVPDASLVPYKTENPHSQVNLNPLLGMHDSEVGTAGATTVLDLLAEVLSDTLIRQTSAVPLIETILESIPYHFDSRLVLNFQALCLDRVMNCIERRLLQDDEGDDAAAPKLDKNSLWSNLGSFCNVIVDGVYMGVFARPASVIRVLEFCLTMLHYANKDGQTTETSLPWSGLLSSIWKGNRPFDAILKSTNRMILYCFLPSFLASTEAELQDETRIDICLVLELLHAHKQIIFHQSNLDTDLYCCLCLNLIALFPDHRKDAQEAAIGVFKYLLVHCRASLETLLVSKTTQVDILNGGFDKLLTENVSSFMHWFQSCEHNIKQVLHQNAGAKWLGYIEDSAKFLEERLKMLEENQTRRRANQEEEAARRDVKYKEECVERRNALELIRETVWSELEFASEKKWKLGIDAENEWRKWIQELGHEHRVEPVSAMAWEDYWPVC